jgi:hypothetical protein
VTRIEIDIPDELATRLKAVFPHSDVVEKLAEIAIEEWVSWIEGSHRPMTISELETHRISAIYNIVGGNGFGQGVVRAL